MAPNDYQEISDRCDESKCVSSGLSSLYNNSFTCYGDNNNTSDGVPFHPMMCADGYLPRVVEDEPPISQLDATATLQYFTCCPPTLPSEAIVARHCSEPETMIETDYDHYYRNGDDIDIDIDIDIDLDVDTNATTATTKICGNNNNNDNRAHLRRMKSKRYFHGENEIDDIESHVCCDSLLVESDATTPEDNHNNNNYLSDTECVPYHSEFYAESEVRNRYGLLASVACHFPEDGTNGFQIPRLFDSQQQQHRRSYECCRTGHSPPPFVTDTAFGLTIYPQIVVSSIAVLCSLVTIGGLSIPLGRQLLLRRTRDTGGGPHVSEMSLPGSTLSLGRLSSSFVTSFRGNGGSNRGLEIPDGSQRSTTADSVDAFLESLRRNKTTSPAAARSSSSSSSKFSTYNLYLVYLAIPDLVMNLYILGMYASYAMSNHHNNSKEFRSGLCGFIISEVGADGCRFSGDDGILFTSVLSGYWAANIYLNAIVAYEVYALLRNSKNFQRHTPPSIRKVTVQASVICACSVAVTVGYYFLNYGEKQAAEQGARELSSALFLVQKVVLNAVLLGFVPILFFPSVCLLIWRRKLMPTITNGATTRDKALRELALYFFRIVSVFALCWIPIAVISAVGGTWRFSITFLVLAMQQIVSTGVSLTKSDVRTHLIDLFALSWCCRRCRANANDSDQISHSSTIHYNNSRPKSSDLVSSTSKMASMAEE